MLIAFVELVKAHESLLVSKIDIVTQVVTSETSSSDLKSDSLSSVYIKCEPPERENLTFEDTSMALDPNIDDDASNDFAHWNEESEANSEDDLSMKQHKTKTTGRIVSKLSFTCAICKKSHQDFETLSAHVIARVSYSYII